MDFGGFVGMDGLVCASKSETASIAPTSFFIPSEGDSRGQKWSFGLFRHENDERRSSKILRTDAVPASSNVSKEASFLLKPSSHCLFPGGEQMLSFSSPKQNVLSLASDGTLQYYHYPPSSSTSSLPAYFRGGGVGVESSNMSMEGVLSGINGSFTQSQWLELEQQALIYKYIDANAPIPSNLLVPMRKGVNQSGLPSFLSGSLRSGTLGWGSYLGYSGNADPEPGRCRRTDGKKWRCSRDAVVDGKYCERHMNRGRHRSRKHVEVQNGQAMKAVTMPVIAPSLAAMAVPGGEPTNNLSASHQPKNMQTVASDPSLQFNRIMNKESANSQNLLTSQGPPPLSSTNSKAPNTLFSNSKSSESDFGLISTNNLLAPARGQSQSIAFNSTSDLNDAQKSQNHPLRPFFDDWSKSQCDRQTISWSNVDDLQLDRTQLSISIPMSSSEFSSSSSSPNHEKLTLSPLKLHREFDPILMGLGVGVPNEANQRQASWIPVSWEASLGGPLGEVLTNTHNTCKDSLKPSSSSSSRNLLADGWGDSSPRLGSSPTGVLQKSNFGSLSSSTGSSPRASENHKPNNITTNFHVNPSVMPSAH